MLTYLRIVNPIVALLVFALCVHAAATDEGVFALSQLLEGSLATYFFAKGIFCGIAVFLLGKILEALLAGGAGSPE